VPDSELPPHVRRFVLTSIPSVPYLEAVLLLRADSSRTWTVSTAARRLYLGEAQVEELLVALTGAGIARPIDGGERAVCYGPATDELATMLDELAELYARNLVAVSSLIHSRVDKRAQQFADAFRWRKDS
jgi:hypothetical protein